MSGDEGFLSRWSRRKRAAAGGTPTGEPSSPPPEAAAATGELAAEPHGAKDLAARPPEPLPPVDSLTIDSDFSPFMAREVDPGVKREALKALFRDERFNVMDGLDVYIDDYTKPAPIPAEWYAKMAQMAYLGDPVGREEAKAKELEAKAKEREIAADGLEPAQDSAAPAIDAPPADTAQGPAPDLSQDDVSPSASATVPSDPGRQ
jgi:hypothetical protein